MMATEVASSTATTLATKTSSATSAAKARGSMRPPIRETGGPKENGSHRRVTVGVISPRVGAVRGELHRLKTGAAYPRGGAPAIAAAGWESASRSTVGRRGSLRRDEPHLAAESV